MIMKNIQISIIHKIFKKKLHNILRYMRFIQNLFLFPFLNRFCTDSKNNYEQIYIMKN